MKGVWLTGYCEDPYKMVQLGKSVGRMEVLTAGLLPDGKDLFVVVADAEGGLGILQYDPERELFFPLPPNFELFDVMGFVIGDRLMNDNRSQILRWTLVIATHNIQSGRPPPNINAPSPAHHAPLTPPPKRSRRSGRSYRPSASAPNNLHNGLVSPPYPSQRNSI